VRFIKSVYGIKIALTLSQKRTENNKTVDIMIEHCKILAYANDCKDRFSFSNGFQEGADNAKSEINKSEISK
jgi:hypothetical protein